MTLKDLKAFVKNGENDHVEFKRKVAHPEKIIREIVAFANTKGGYLFIGVDDDGRLPGLKFAEEEIFELDKYIGKYCKPKIAYSTEIININAKKAIVSYKINEGTKKPHYVLENLLALDHPVNYDPVYSSPQKVAPKNKKFGTAYVRVEDKTLKASKEVWQILKRNSKPKDVKFNYGEKEHLLMQYLRDNKNITLNRYAQIASLSRFKASQKLVLLVSANVLEIIPQEKEDIFRLRYGW